MTVMMSMISEVAFTSRQAQAQCVLIYPIVLDILGMINMFEILQVWGNGKAT